jgi:PiT family inorganic phosphate transporter
MSALGLDPITLVFLIFAVLLALSFEFVNGFHDTANAVATVIYTHSLTPTQAVVWSGVWNLIGVLTSAGTVAFGIIALLPVELVINVGSGPGFAMVFSLLISAIVWNLGTWYLGLPASSSHTLIGSIVGVGLMNSLLSPGSAFGDGVNWVKVSDTVKALLLSPVVGFVFAALLLLLAKRLLRNPSLYSAPEGNQPPPGWIRGLLVLTCTGVSFAHGSNDGQKGMGLIMLILVGIAPVGFALNQDASPELLAQVEQQAAQLRGSLTQAGITPLAGGTDAAQAELTRFLSKKTVTAETLSALAAVNDEVVQKLGSVKRIGDISATDRRATRMDIYLVTETLARFAKSGQGLPANVDAKAAADYSDALKKLTSFIPLWVKIAVAVALGLGTMIGWKRIVITVGEKIGKAHLTYAQGASAEIVAFGTIEAADLLGLPVSTTHVLSSGIAGTMVANGSGVQKDTLRNVLLAWVLTLPVCVFLGATLFAAGLFFVLHVLGIH